MPDESVLLGELAEEFTNRVRQGQLPEIEEYARQHPALAERIRALFPTLMVLEGMAGGAVNRSSEDKSPDMAPGSTFGNFRIEREIGRGGMGVVYEATHLALNKRVALKVLPVQGVREAKQLERFLREAQTAAGLHHTNIVPVFDVGQVNGIPYYAMQYIEGRGLDRVLQEVQGGQAAAGPPPTVALTEVGPAADSPATTPLAAPAASVPPAGGAAAYFRWVAEVGIQAALGLDHAHERGVIHRDIKPSNLILDRQGAIWITDFGLARRTEDPALTHSGAILGTPRYMSPEQAAAARQGVDHRTDVYSLGATLYELLTRRPAFDGPTPLEIVMQIIERSPVPPRKLNPAIPRDLETIVLKAMAKRPEDRYRTAAALADDLGSWLKLEPIRARRIGPLGRTIRWCRRNPKLAAVTVGAAAIILVLSGLFAYGRKLDFDTVVAALGREREATYQLETALREAEKQRERAEFAVKEARVHLCRSYYEQAIAVRTSVQPGRRSQALELLKKAEKLRQDLKDGIREPGVVDWEFRGAEDWWCPGRHHLRTEAVAALLLRDARLLREVPAGTLAMPASLSADGRKAAVPWLDLNAKRHGVQLLDLETGQELAHWPHPEIVLSTGLSREGKSLAYALNPQQVRVLDLPQGKQPIDLTVPAQEKKHHQATVLAGLAFSPDGRYLVAAQAHVERIDMVLWDLKSGKGKVLGEGQALTRPAFAPDGRRLVFTSGAKKVAIWDLASQTQEREIELPEHPLGAADYSSDGRLLAVACKDLKEPRTLIVVVWDTTRNVEQARWTVDGVGQATPALAFHPAGREIAVTQGPVNILIVDAFTGKERYRLEGAHKGPVVDLVWQPRGEHLISQDLTGSIKVWQLARSPRATLELEEPFTDFTFSPDGMLLAVRDREKQQIRLVDRDTGKVRQVLPRIGTVSFRPDGRQLAVISLLKLPLYQTLVYDVETGKEAARVDGKEILGSPAWARNGPLATVKAKQGLSVWDLTENREVRRIPTGTQPDMASLSPDGRMLAALEFAPEASPLFTLWEVSSGRQLGDIEWGWRGLNSVPLIVEWSGDGRWLAVGWLGVGSDARTGKPAEGGITVWELPSLKKHLEFARGPLHGRLAFSLDGKLLAIASVDKSISLWHLERRELLFRWSATLATPVECLGFAPDGKSISWSEFQTRALYTLQLAELRRELATLGLDW